MWLDKFCQNGKADVIVGGQFGSEGKGSAAAYLAKRLAEVNRFYNFYTVNFGAQAGHTSVHNGNKRVVFHLPTAALIARDYGQQPLIYINGGAIIDVDVLMQELRDNDLGPDNVFIHPNAAVITDGCRAAEGAADSAQTKIASTRKGVGQALARKVLRSGLIARDCRALYRHVAAGIEFNTRLRQNSSVLIEVPQGIGLSVDSQFYPYCTSRNCTLQQGMADAGIHPHFLGASMLVLRTFPIRVGNIAEGGKLLGTSGDIWSDQHETTWEELGVPAEITTVTKRVRRVFTYSMQQAHHSMTLTRPDVVHLTFCDYVKDQLALSKMVGDLHAMARYEKFSTTVLMQSGPTTDDVKSGTLDNP